MSNDRVKMVAKEIAYDFETLTGEHTYELSTSSDSAEIRQHGMLASKLRVNSLPVDIKDAISLYAILLTDMNDEIPEPVETTKLLQHAMTIFVTHMLKTGALKLGNV